MRIGVYGLFFFMVGYARWTKDLCPCQRRFVPSLPTHLFHGSISLHLLDSPLGRNRPNRANETHPIPSLPRRIARLARATEQEAHLLQPLAKRVLARHLGGVL